MTDRILDQMIRLHIVDSEEAEIYRFGLEGLLLKIVHYISYLLIAILFGEVLQFLLFFAAFMVLRKSAGGYHAKTKAGCYIVSCLTVAVEVTSIKFIAAWKYAVEICLILTIVADGFILRIAPLGNHNRELDETEIRYFRKRTLIFLAVENFIIFLLFITKQTYCAIPVVLAIFCQMILLISGKIGVIF